MKRLATIPTVDGALVDVVADSRQRLCAPAGQRLERQHGAGSGAGPHGRLRGLKNPTAAVIRRRDGLMRSTDARAVRATIAGWNPSTRTDAARRPP